MCASVNPRSASKWFAVAILALAAFSVGNVTRTGASQSPVFAGGPITAYPGAENLAVVSQSCLTLGGVRVEFSWKTFDEGPQFIDLTIFNNNFAAGTFIGAGPIDSTQSTFVWDGLVPNQRHYARVNTNTFAGWITSNTVTFQTPSDCGPPPPEGYGSCRDEVSYVSRASSAVATFRDKYVQYQGTPSHGTANDILEFGNLLDSFAYSMDSITPIPEACYALHSRVVEAAYAARDEVRSFRFISSEADALAWLARVERSLDELDAALVTLINGASLQVNVPSRR